MFISAYSPLFLIFAVRDFDFDRTHWLKHPFIIFWLLAITAVAIIALFIILRRIENGGMSIKVTSVKNRSVDLFNYSILYVICFFAIDLSRPGDLISMGIFLVLMLWLTISTKSIFLNPILSMGGYGLYDLDYEFDGKSFSTVVLSRFELKENNNYYIRSISRFLYLIIKEKSRE